jgi:signal transduction histidine kinase
VGGGLNSRTLTASVLLSAIIGGAFFLLVLAISGLRSSADGASDSEEVLVAANQLERLVVDLETGERGFIITGDASFLQPWYTARAAFPAKAAALERLAAEHGPGQRARAHQIRTATSAYIRDYSLRVVAAARHDRPSVQTVAVTMEGKHRLDAIRARFSSFVTAEQQLLATRQALAATDARRATVTAAVGVGGSITLIMLAGGYLARAVVRPVRRASLMADRVAGGNLSTRLPGTGPAEIGTLQRSLNAMAGSLAAGRDEIQRTSDEQAALRRVATLVARAGAPPEVFAAVAAETGRIVGAQCIAVARYGPDGTATVTGSWGHPGNPGLAPALDSRWPATGACILGQVLRTGATARLNSYQPAAGTVSAWAWEHAGVHSAVGTPIYADGQVWGVIIAFLTAADPPPDTEKRLLGFTELAAMAIANTEYRAQLIASRARVVAAADETRRRIERDLHDGTQQRLVSIALELRAAQARLPIGHTETGRQYAQTAQDLSDVAEDLRTISRGLHPAILEKGGLGPALRALARRSGLPAELHVRLGRRLSEQVEVAVYYVVSEALTNAAKHAGASVVEVDLGIIGQLVRLAIRDNGVGGADPARGSGLIGLRDRIETLGGRIDITSVPGDGTTMLARIPLGTDSPDGLAEHRHPAGS